MPRAEQRHTVIVLSVSVRTVRHSVTHISSLAENQALKLATQAEIDIILIRFVLKEFRFKA